jgi:transposase
MEKLTLLGIDIAKNVFQLHGVDDKGNAVLRDLFRKTKNRKLRRNGPIDSFKLKNFNAYH